RRTPSPRRRRSKPARPSPRPARCPGPPLRCWWYFLRRRNRRRAPPSTPPNELAYGETKPGPRHLKGSHLRTSAHSRRARAVSFFSGSRVHPPKPMSMSNRPLRRSFRLFRLGSLSLSLSLAGAACGGSVTPTPAPHLVPGGGVGDGPINGHLAVYV